MGVMRKTRIVVPCYNESQRLSPQAFLLALEENPQLSFLFVDDGSSDGTQSILSAMEKQNPAQVEILSLVKNSGKAEAVRRGMLKAMEGPFDNVGYWDADLATPLHVIRDFCALLDTGDTHAVIGSRVCLLGRKIERKVTRHYLGRAFATCASLLLKIRIYDTQCGAKIFRNSTTLRGVFSAPFKVKWTFDVEMFARFSLIQGCPAEEVSSKWFEYPLLEWVDVKGSKIRGTDYLKGGLEFGMLLLYLRTPARRRYRRYLEQERLLQR